MCMGKGVRSVGCHFQMRTQALKYLVRSSALVGGMRTALTGMAVMETTSAVMGLREMMAPARGPSGRVPWAIVFFGVGTAIVVFVVC